MVLGGYMTLAAISSASCRQRGQRNYRNHGRKSRNMSSHGNHWSETSDISTDQNHATNDDNNDGRHAYLMTADRIVNPEVTELDDDHILAQAFAKHIGPANKHLKNLHDVYAYKLPSDLWFIIRYSKNIDGQFEKYMNIVDSVTTYLDKLNEDVTTVSINVKGVETVFRLVKPNKQS